ncbi:PepSY domain-containing protein [Gillisia sp. M10.2A]|uniref:PepSY domain-containing protein n=1 Tax=Gillisia lutea TaxID=2909668 RepID=A0ABS9EG62_9FLAO|nr:PepSY-associated TM helix domain-containing protein [Gillisia lutea]MCF4101875.1 PepSY domain-containing protein [Gillisia lutea]
MGQSKPRKNLRKLIRKIHLYLGLATGLVVLIVSLTGCLWVFQEEITSLTSTIPEVSPQNASPLDPLEAKEIAQAEYPGKHVHGTLYKGGDSPIEVIFYQEEPLFYSSVFIEPWTGQLLHTQNHLKGFFPFVLDGHMHLWLPDEIGSQIVAWSTFIFFLMLVSGIILWWPKNKKVRKQRTWFQWKTSTKWKRKNYDLHQIIGFYASFIAVIFIFTGLIMTFDSFANFFYKGIGGEKDVTFMVPENLTGPMTAEAGNEPIRKLLPMLQEKFPNAKDYEIHYPYDENYSIYVEVSNSDGIYYDSDYRFYDQNDLSEIPSKSIYSVYEEAGVAETILRMNYDTHVGAIAGIPGKILAFLISLLCASLPVTGFLLWYGREFKAKKTLNAKQKEVTVTELK